MCGAFGHGNTRDSARRSRRETRRIPTRTPGREQPSGPGPGSTPRPNRGVAHAPNDSAGFERRAADGTMRRPPKDSSCWAEVAGAATVLTAWTPLCPEAAVFGSVVQTASVCTPTTAFCRGSPRGVSHSNPDAGATVKRQPQSSSSSCSDHGPDPSPLPADRPPLTQGANTLSAWRERPRPWPQAWQAKRPFRVVAHATGLLLATAPAVAPPGGRQRAPPDDDGL